MSQVPLSAVSTIDQAAGSPPSTQLSIAAALSFNGQPVRIVTGNLLGSQGITLIFSLSNPVAIGNLAEFIQWAAGQWGVTVTYDEIENVVNKIPLQFLQDALTSVLKANLTITILNISIQPNLPTYVQIAATLDFSADPLGPSWLSLTEVGFMLTQGQSTASP